MVTTSALPSQQHPVSAGSIAVDRIRRVAVSSKPVCWQKRADMYLRFTILRKDEYSHARQGVLVAGHLLRDEGDLDSYEYKSLCASLAWFNKYLRVPAILNEQECERAISWFKSEARSPIDQMWNLVAILRVLGVGVHLFKTDNPGTIVYEDDWQVVAKPYRKDKGRW